MVRSGQDWSDMAVVKQFGWRIQLAASNWQCKGGVDFFVGFSLLFLSNLDSPYDRIVQLQFEAENFSLIYIYIYLDYKVLKMLIDNVIQNSIVFAFYIAINFISKDVTFLIGLDWI